MACLLKLLVQLKQDRFSKILFEKTISSLKNGYILNIFWNIL